MVPRQFVLPLSPPRLWALGTAGCGAGNEQNNPSLGHSSLSLGGLGGLQLALHQGTALPEHFHVI